MLLALINSKLIIELVNNRGDRLFYRAVYFCDNRFAYDWRNARKHKRSSISQNTAYFRRLYFPKGNTTYDLSATHYQHTLKKDARMMG